MFERIERARYFFQGLGIFFRILGRIPRNTGGIIITLMLAVMVVSYEMHTPDHNPTILFGTHTVATFLGWAALVVIVSFLIALGITRWMEAHWMDVEIEWGFSKKKTTPKPRKFPRLTHRR